jgi:acetyl esterase/lipase
LWFSLITAISNQEPTNKIPVYLQHCAFDPLRDDVKIYGQQLESRGVPIKIDLFPEDGHQTWSFVSPLSKWKNPTIQEGQMAGMKWLLSLSACTFLAIREKRSWLVFKRNNDTVSKIVLS